MTSETLSARVAGLGADSAGALTPGTISEDLLTTLKSQGIVVVVSPRTDLDGSSTQVRDLAFGATYGGKGPTSLDLATVTVENYGEALDPKNPDGPISLFVDHRLCWVVMYAGVPTFISGPYLPGNERANLPQFEEATTVVLLDALTGEFLLAQTAS